MSHITSPQTTWCTLLLLLCLHLATNYAAVRAVRMQTLNRQRANLVFSHVFEHGVVPSPRDVAARERIWERDGVLRWANDQVLGKCRVGVSFHELSRSLAAGPHGVEVIVGLLAVFKTQGYVLWPAPSPADETLILLKTGCSPMDQFKAWAHALLLAARAHHDKGQEAASSSSSSWRRRRKPDGATAATTTTTDKHTITRLLLAELSDTLHQVQTMFDQHGETMRAQGWNLDVSAMETKAGVRLHIS